MPRSQTRPLTQAAREELPSGFGLDRGSTTRTLRNTLETLQSNTTFTYAWNELSYACHFNGRASQAVGRAGSDTRSAMRRPLFALYAEH